MLVTVPLDTVISPLLPSAAEGCGAGDADEGDEDIGRSVSCLLLGRIRMENLSRAPPPRRSTVEIPELASS